MIIHRTLIALGLAPTLLDVHLIQKGSSIHDDEERSAMQSKDPKYIIVVDQGSRPAPPVVDSPHVKSLIIDHHLSDEFPENALVNIVRPMHYCRLTDVLGRLSVPLSTSRYIGIAGLRDLQTTTS